TFKSILKIKEQIDEKKILLLGKKLPTAKKLMRYLYKKPVVTVQDIREELSVSLPTANSLVSDFEKLGILNEKTGYKRNREFEFSDYLKLFKE
ncbi:MAG: winged helix-turn-helix transcriptional regulator, partial [Ignavibacteria bacterium]|nr:winged helix-turn-helix transcriptional regulator [Ignavibacteria bacterium]